MVDDNILTTIEPGLSREEKEDLVLFPETHSKRTNLIDVNFDLHPLPIGVCKKIARKMAPIGAGFERAAKGGGDAGDPELDINTIDALVDCLVIMAGHYKLPSSITKERIEEEVAPEDVIGILKLQLVINKENNFLLQNLRSILQMIDLVAMIGPLAKQPSTLPGVSDGESASISLPANIQQDN